MQEVLEWPTFLQRSLLDLLASAGGGGKRCEFSCQPEVTGGPSGTAHAVHDVPRRRRGSRGSGYLQARAFRKGLLRGSSLVYSLVSLPIYICTLAVASSRTWHTDLRKRVHLLSIQKTCKPSPKDQGGDACVGMFWQGRWGSAPHSAEVFLWLDLLPSLSDSSERCIPSQFLLFTCVHSACGSLTSQVKKGRIFLLYLLGRGDANCKPDTVL